MDDDSVTINTHRYIAVIVGDKDLKQIAERYDVSAIWGAKMGGALADALEDSLAALWSSITTNTVGDTATVLTDAEIRQAVEKLDTLNTPLDECAFFFHPYTYWNQIHAISKYYDQSSVGPNNVAGMVATGNFPRKPNQWYVLYAELFTESLYTLLQTLFLVFKLTVTFFFTRVHSLLQCKLWELTEVRLESRQKTKSAISVCLWSLISFTVSRLYVSQVRY